VYIKSEQVVLSELNSHKAHHCHRISLSAPSFLPLLVGYLSFPRSELVLPLREVKTEELRGVEKSLSELKELFNEELEGYLGFFGPKVAGSRTVGSSGVVND